jgi:D-3-phosphoglycerate dehydrogenase
MADWKILITDGLQTGGLDILRLAAQVDDCNGISALDLLRVIAEYDALIVRSRTRLTPDLFQAAKRLRVVGRAGVGVDNIDLQAARDHGVIVVNAPASTTTAVAELTIGLMFSLARNIPRADAAMKNGLWLKQDLVGAELDGKILGVMGMGNIGSAVARRAAALGMSVLGFDAWLAFDEIIRRGAQPVPLDELYYRSDFISLHVPLTDETRGMIGEQAVNRMKSGVRLICTARGGVVDEGALLNALQSGKVAGAALDVFAQEPPGRAELISLPNVIATPHIGAQTIESQERAAADIAAEVLAALRGERLRWNIF